MDKKLVGAFVVTLIALVLTVSLKYYTSNQSDQTGIPSPTPTPTGEPEVTYDYVVYEWYLKAEFINNVTWLSQVYYNYSVTQTWLENYIGYLESMYYSTFPPDRLFPPNLYRNAFINAEFSVATGWTKAVYEYFAEPHYSFWNDGSLNYCYYSIETILPTLADNRNWTKTYV